MSATTTKLTAGTQDAIYTAARAVLMRKGLDGARMQDIADEAGINKALLHYYFRSKEGLFSEVFQREMADFDRGMREVMASDLPVVEKLARCAEADVDHFQEHPDRPLFLLNEMGRNPEVVRQFICQNDKRGAVADFRRQVADEVASGRLRPDADADQILLDLISLVVFPYLAREMICETFGLEPEQYTELLAKRRTHIGQILADHLRPLP